MSKLVKVNEAGAELISKKSYENEKYLQEIIKRHPEIIPLDEIEKNSKLKMHEIKQ